MSQCLREHSVDHVILERGRVANSWRTERWDSLRLLTPNWQSRLPGFRYETPDADGFMTVPEVIGFIEDYAGNISAPVHEETEVTSVRAGSDGFRVATDQGDWRCRTVVPRQRRLQSRRCARARTGHPGVDLQLDCDGVPESRFAATRRRAGGGRVRHRRPDRGRDPSIRSPRNAVRRRARAFATHLSEPRYPLVDGRRRCPRRALRRNGRHRARAERAFATTGGHARAVHTRPQTH